MWKYYVINCNDIHQWTIWNRDCCHTTYFAIVHSTTKSYLEVIIWQFRNRSLEFWLLRFFLAFWVSLLYFGRICCSLIWNIHDILRFYGILVDFILNFSSLLKILCSFLWLLKSLLNSFKYFEIVIRLNALLQTIVEFYLNLAAVQLGFYYPIVATQFVLIGVRFNTLVQITTYVTSPCWTTSPIKQCSF